MRKRLFAVLFVVGILCAGVASAGWFDWFDRFFEKPELSPSEQCGVFIDITPVPIRASTQDSLHPLSHSVDSNLQTYWTVGSVVSTSDELVYDLGNVLCIMGGSIMLPQGTGVGLSVFISEDG
ncbi:MAG TPA: hypothetical protein VJK51_05545, partial [Candidatus Nanoarchaeia archaeon]|nr:hypothetical protein [Candidatus Nanoarchaeia archaeon]